MDVASACISVHFCNQWWLHLWHLLITAFLLVCHHVTLSTLLVEHVVLFEGDTENIKVPNYPYLCLCYISPQNVTKRLKNAHDYSQVDAI
jgi:hypothetical protein